MKRIIFMTTAIAFLLIGCGGGTGETTNPQKIDSNITNNANNTSDNDTNDNNTTNNEENNTSDEGLQINRVIVERGHLYQATIVDASGQIATPIAIYSNQYQFKNTIEFPVMVIGGWVDVNNNQEMDAGIDFELDLPMYSNTRYITPLTDYIAQGEEALTGNDSAGRLEILDRTRFVQNTTSGLDNTHNVLSDLTVQDIILANVLYEYKLLYGFDTSYYTPRDNGVFDDLKQIYEDELVRQGLNDDSDINTVAIALETFLVQRKSESLKMLTPEKISEYIQLQSQFLDGNLTANTKIFDKKILEDTPLDSYIKENNVTFGFDYKMVESGLEGDDITSLYGSGINYMYYNRKYEVRVDDPYLTYDAYVYSFVNITEHQFPMNFDSKEKVENFFEGNRLYVLNRENRDPLQLITKEYYLNNKDTTDFGSTYSEKPEYLDSALKLNTIDKFELISNNKVLKVLTTDKKLYYFTFKNFDDSIEMTSTMIPSSDINDTTTLPISMTVRLLKEDKAESFSENLLFCHNFQSECDSKKIFHSLISLNTTIVFHEYSPLYKDHIMTSTDLYKPTDTAISCSEKIDYHYLGKVDLNESEGFEKDIYYSQLENHFCVQYNLGNTIMSGNKTSKLDMDDMFIDPRFVSSYY